MGLSSATDSSRSLSPPADVQGPSFRRRLGGQALTLLAASTVVILAAAGFITFLWFAGLDNNVWHKVMVNGWATRAVTVTTLALRFAVDLQAGLAGAMLAAIILEISTVRLHHIAKVSIMRGSSPPPRDVLGLISAMYDTGRFFPSLGCVAYGSLIVLLFLTTTGLQFSSTLLLSDLDLGQLPGLALTQNTSYDFVYDPEGETNDASFYRFSGYSYPIQLRTSTWLRPPPAFPAFAEYSSPLPERGGVDDTGLLLRAFLPFPDAETRESIRNYTGTAMVLDSRVSCQRPMLSHLKISVPSNTSTSGYTGKITGRLRPSVPDVDRLWTPGPVAFECALFPRDGALTICQISTLHPLYDSYANNGGLLSEFWNITHNDTKDALEGGMQLYSLPMLVIQAQNITHSTINHKVLGIQDDGIWTNVETPSQTWSVSICYSAFATADLEVNIHSESGRKEPIVHWSSDRGYYTVPDVHAQLGELAFKTTSPSSRGILQMDKEPSWFPSEDHALINAVQPFVQQFVDVTNPMLTLCPTAPYCSAMLPPSSHDHPWFYGEYVYNGNRAETGMFLADLTISSLFHQTLDAGNRTGSLARAMSSLITILSSTAYYDQMPQFARSSNSTQTYFTKILFRQSRLGYWVVMGILATHVGLVGCIAIGFAVYSKHTLLGNHWQSIAQLRGPETEDLLAKTRMSSDSEVKKALAAAGCDDLRVSVRGFKNGRTAGLQVARRERGERDRDSEP